MSDAIESLIVEPILEDSVLELDERTRAFFKRAGHDFPADGHWLFRPLHPGDYAAGLMYDNKGRKMEAGFGYTVVDGMLVIDEHVSFPLEFAYMLEVQIAEVPPLTWPLPGSQPGQGWSIQPPFNPPPHGGTWTWPGPTTPLIGPGSMPWSTTNGNGTVYYGAVGNSAHGVAHYDVTISGMSGATMNSSSSGPATIADFAAIRASGATVTGVGT